MNRWASPKWASEHPCNTEMASPKWPFATPVRNTRVWACESLLLAKKFPARTHATRNRPVHTPQSPGRRFGVWGEFRWAPLSSWRRFGVRDSTLRWHGFVVKPKSTIARETDVAATQRTTRRRAPRPREACTFKFTNVNQVQLCLSFKSTNLELPNNNCQI